MKGAVRVAFAVFLLLWAGVLVFVFSPDFHLPGAPNPADGTTGLRGPKPPPVAVTSFLPSLPSANRAVPQLPLRSQEQQPLRPAPPPVEEAVANISSYLQALHERFVAIAGPKVTAEQIWEAYVDVTEKKLAQYDRANKQRIPLPRSDDSIFVSVASYRDEYCPQTLIDMYEKAANPEKLYIGLVQQNCEANCKSGVLENGKVEDAPPDIDCYKEFCASAHGKLPCSQGRVVVVRISESESLGPMAARYLASKLYRGESYYLQIDSHSLFAQDWDKALLQIVANAPSEKPVITAYPPPVQMAWQNTIGYRMCDALFASSDIEWQIVRLGASMKYDQVYSDVPRYAPFVAAGFFFVSGTFLHDVPFDPFVPWVFMGEEISLSLRLWTSGYDIFSPTKNVLAHYYIRKHKPKFWESVNRLFRNQVHNPIVALVIKRIKNLLGYPESSRELLYPPSLLYRLEEYHIGSERPAELYWKMVGLDVRTKKFTEQEWCHKGKKPAVYEELWTMKRQKGRLD